MRNIWYGDKTVFGTKPKTLVPRVIGSTINAQNIKSIKTTGGGSKWNEERFFEDVAKKFPKHLDTYREIYERSVLLFDEIWWGSGNRHGSFIPGLRIDGKFFQLYGVYVGSVEIQFQYLKAKAPYDQIDKRNALLEKINLALNINLDTIDRRPNLKLEVLERPGSLEEFFKVTEWYLNDIKQYYKSIGKL